MREGFEEFWGEFSRKILFPQINMRDSFDRSRRSAILEQIKRDAKEYWDQNISEELILRTLRIDFRDVDFL